MTNKEAWVAFAASLLREFNGTATDFHNFAAVDIATCADVMLAELKRRKFSGKPFERDLFALPDMCLFDGQFQRMSPEEQDQELKKIRAAQLKKIRAAQPKRTGSRGTK